MASFIPGLRKSLKGTRWSWEGCARQYHGWPDRSALLPQVWESLDTVSHQPAQDVVIRRIVLGKTSHVDGFLGMSVIYEVAQAYHTPCEQALHCSLLEGFTSEGEM
jgi:hypothetical protein